MTLNILEPPAEAESAPEAGRQEKSGFNVTAFIIAALCCVALAVIVLYPIPKIINDTVDANKKGK